MTTATNMQQSSLISAMNKQNVTTLNGMPAQTSTMDFCVDLFFKIGASRGQDIIPQFSKAFAEDADVATRIALHARDIRGGSGERQLFRNIAAYIANKDVNLAKRVMAKIPELGRWDDILVFFGTPVERDALSMINHALRSQDSLCAKWMPRKGEAANKIRAYMKVSPKVYRKLLVTLSDTVEQKLCANEYQTVNYNHVPSVAAARYQATFMRHDEKRYTAYRESLKTGDKSVKINAGAVYPYDVIKSLRFGDKAIADAQWKALPDYLKDSDENILTVVDVSGSMDCPAGNNPNVSCMDVAISLGLYLSERSNGKFKDAFVTFSSKPELQIVRGSLSDRYTQMARSAWQMNTNLEAVFDLILNSAVKGNVPAEDMPSIVLILSDMQFDQCIPTPSHSAMQMISRKYENHGYKVPKVVFWNLKAYNNVPVSFNQAGVALVSGFSPAIMAAVLGADVDEFSPRSIMLKAVMQDRYNY